MKFTVQVARTSFFDAYEPMIYTKTFAHAVDAVKYRNHILHKENYSLRWVMIVPEKG